MSSSGLEEVFFAAEPVTAGRDEAGTKGSAVARLLLPRGCFSTGTAGTAGRVAVVSAISKSSRHPGHLKGRAFPEKFKDSQKVQLS